MRHISHNPRAKRRKGKQSFPGTEFVYIWVTGRPLAIFRKEMFMKKLQKGFTLIELMIVECQLRDQNLACFGKHSLLSGREAAVVLPAPQIPYHLRDLNHIA